MIQEFKNLFENKVNENVFEFRRTKSNRIDCNSFLKKCFTRYKFIFLKFTDLNDEFIEAFKDIVTKNDIYIAKITEKDFDVILQGMDIGGWTLFFLNNDIEYSEVLKVTYNSDAIDELGKKTGAKVIISSYLDDTEWMVFFNENKK